VPTQNCGTWVKGKTVPPGEGKAPRRGRTNTAKEKPWATSEANPRQGMTSVRNCIYRSTKKGGSAPAQQRVISSEKEGKRARVLKKKRTAKERKSRKPSILQGRPARSKETANGVKVKKKEAENCLNYTCETTSCLLSTRHRQTCTQTSYTAGVGAKGGHPTGISRKTKRDENSCRYWDKAYPKHSTRKAV